MTVFRRKVTSAQLRRQEREMEKQKRLAGVKATPGELNDLADICSHIYTDDEIKKWRMDESINDNPLHRKPTIMRSKLAYREVLKELRPSTKYLLPGQISIFLYRNPKYADELEYYDGTPLTIFFGITRTKDGNIRELGFNLHYYPPFARMKIMNAVYEVFKDYYSKYFNEAPNKPNKYLNYKVLKTMLKRQKISFGLRMYIPVLRGKTYVLPTKLLPTAFYTEGHFNKATLKEIQKYWRQAVKK